MNKLRSVCTNHNWLNQFKVSFLNWYRLKNSFIYKRDSDGSNQYFEYIFHGLKVKNQKRHSYNLTFILTKTLLIR